MIKVDEVMGYSVQESIHVETHPSIRERKRSSANGSHPDSLSYEVKVLTLT